MSTESVLKLVDSGLPAGVPGISNILGNGSGATSQVNASPGGGMPGVPTPQVGGQSNGSPDFLKMLGMRGKNG
jgi:hypothetical protein